MMKDSEINFKHSELTGRIIKAFYKVYNVLGYGFLEKVYENAFFNRVEKNRLTMFTTISN